MTKVPSLVNYGTKYELTISRDHQTFLLAYTMRHGRADLVRAIRNRGEMLLRVLALAEDARFEFISTKQPKARLGDWTIEFTGRTQKDAICTRSEHSYIGSL